MKWQISKVKKPRLKKSLQGMPIEEKKFFLFIRISEKFQTLNKKDRSE